MPCTGVNVVVMALHLLKGRGTGGTHKKTPSEPAGLQQDPASENLARAGTATPGQGRFFHHRGGATGQDHAGTLAVPRLGSQAEAHRDTPEKLAKPAKTG
jgi:hypothetical protein